MNKRTTKKAKGIKELLSVCNKSGTCATKEERLESELDIAIGMIISQKMKIVSLERAMRNAGTCACCEHKHNK